MVRILDKIIENIEKLKFKKMRGRNCEIECKENSYIGYVPHKINSKADIREEIRSLIKENEKYFVSEIVSRTKEVMLNRGKGYIEDLKMSGYTFRVSAENFEKYGVFMYINDLCRSVYAPERVKSELGRLIYEYGIEKVTEEIEIYMKEYHSEKFGIRIVRNPWFFKKRLKTNEK